MANQTQFSPLKIGIFRQIVPLIFPSDDEGRARSAEKFSMYDSFSYGLLKKKGARSADIVSIEAGRPKEINRKFGIFRIAISLES